VAKSGQDGRNNTKRSGAPGFGPGPRAERKVIVFMLGNSLQRNSEGMQDESGSLST